MNPETICVSLETAKKLKEAGWDKETVFVWVDDPTGAFIHRCGVGGYPDYPAPTASEIPIDKDCEVEHTEENTYLVIQYAVMETIVYPESSSEVEARAACWLKIKEAK